MLSTFYMPNLFSQVWEIEPNDSLAVNSNPIIAASGVYSGQVEWDSLSGYGDIDIWKISPGSSGSLSIALFYYSDGSQLFGGLYESYTPYDLGTYLGVSGSYELSSENYYFLFTEGYEPILQVASNLYCWSVNFPSGVDEEYESNITTYKLCQNYPNPFNLTTLIKYVLPVDCRVRSEIYNILGQKVKTLVDGHQRAGYKKAIWDSKSDGGVEVASGIYLYRMKAADFTKVKKMVILK